MTLPGILFNVKLVIAYFFAMPHLATNDTAWHSIQCKISNNLLFRNKKLYTFGITSTALCSFCNNLGF